MKKLVPGFTLIEVMIVVAIVGILAAIAYPSYVDSVRKGRRAEAIAALYGIQLAQERWRANNATYGTLAQVWPGTTNIPATGTAYYVLTTTAGVAPTSSQFSILATAQPAGGQNNDTANGASCTALTINQTGPNYGTGTPNQAACWGKN